MKTRKGMSFTDAASLGGKARRKKLSAEQRRAIARAAAHALHARRTPAERIEAARKAVLVRWKKYRVAKRKAAKP